MSRLAWLTPEDAPGTALCRTVFIPAGLHYEAAFRGAYLILCDPENWEEMGAQTPEACAAAFQDAFFQTLENWAECPEVIMPIVGEIRTFASSPPTGWLNCDGTNRYIANYPDLYAEIGFYFGGNFDDQFALPDLRGRFVANTGDNGESSYDLGDTGGQDFTTLTLAQMPAHDHTVPVKNGTGTQTRIQTITTSGAPTTVTTSSAGSGGQQENRPPFLALYLAIYAGAYVP